MEKKLKKKKIWIITELIYPDETATAYIFTKIANFLSTSYEVNIITGPSFYESKNFKPNPKEKLLSHIKVFRKKSLGLNKNFLAQRTFNFIYLSLVLFFTILKKVKKDETILMATNPAILILLVSLIKKVRKFNVTVLVHDVFPENTIPAGIFKSKKNFIYKILKFFFNYSYSRFDHLIVLGRDMEILVRDKVNNYNPKLPISIITNWVNTTKIFPIDNNEKTKKIIFQYAGNIGRVQGLEFVVQIFKKTSNKNLELIIRGLGANYDKINHLCKKCSHINIKGSYLREKENEILNLCDIAVISLSPGMFGLGVPSKAYVAMAAGKPILFIGNPKSEIALLIKENEIGWVLDINDIKRNIDFLNKLRLIDKPIFKNIGLKARRIALEHFNEHKILKKFQSKIDELTYN